MGGGGGGWKSFARNEGKAGIGSWFCNTGMGNF